MTNAELYALFFYSGMALLFAVGLVLVQGAFLSVESRFSRWTLPAVPLLMCVGLAVSTILSGRNLKFAALDIRSIGSLDGAGGGSIQRAITAVILALCFAKIVNVLMKRGRLPLPQGGRALLTSFLALTISTHVLSATFGAVPSFVHNSYYPPIVFVAMFLARPEGLERCFDALKLGLVLLVFGSLVVAVAMPGLAIQQDYAGWVPGLKIRLWGLGSNANSIGPLALLLALLEVMRPYRAPWLRVLVWVATLTVFVLAQSKTVWLIAAMMAAFMLIYGGSRDGRGQIRMGFLAFILAAVAVAALGLLMVDADRVSAKLMGTQVGTDLSTLTGRATIWAMAIRTWLDNVWFGYGPDAWGPLFRARIGLPFAFHAHNQFLNTLSSAGIFGGVALITYLSVMIWASIRAARISRGVSLGLMLFMVGRCFTEVPLDVEGLFVGETIMHLAWYMVVLMPFASARHATSTAETSPLPVTVGHQSLSPVGAR